MPQVPVFNLEGKQVDTIDLNDKIFAAPIKEVAIHQAAVRQLANRRQGTASTKTRAAVSGGGAKPWRQKGTGRARQGSTRAPQWRHGGVVFGPHPRDYRQEMPRKARRAAVRSMLTSKVTENRIWVLDQLQLEEGKTKRVVALLSALNVTGKALISLGSHDENTVRAARNLPGVKTLPAANLNALDLLDYDNLILTREGVDVLERFLA
ncbi:MAG TPA: 50S ribosomal protein L4 [Chloroflexota bacterium]|nr:50S ribosomal protein L4 [Chloroflexota bacterium]